MEKQFTQKDGISLKEYFEMRLESVKIATELARESLEKRLEGMNEFRQSMKDQANNFVTRVEYKTLYEKMEDLKEMVNKRPTWLMTFVFLIMSFLLGIVAKNFFE